VPADPGTTPRRGLTWPRFCSPERLEQALVFHCLPACRRSGDRYVPAMSEKRLQGLRVAVLAVDGFEQVEVTIPMRARTRRGC
jgi:hypothetical protein